MISWELLALALGLAADATAVAVARGVSARQIAARDAVRVALVFGGFQALMPLLGSLLGRAIGSRVSAWDHWIVFVVLAGLGLKMLGDALFRHDEKPAPTEQEPVEIKVLVLLGVATSIDALAVGVTLPLMGAPLGPSIATIGIVTGLTSAIGLYAGRRFGARLGKRVDVVGGLLLIAVGLNLLIDHLSGRA
jgi:putative Mn2+ efflux pump MntP